MAPLDISMDGSHISRQTIIIQSCMHFLVVAHTPTDIRLNEYRNVLRQLSHEYKQIAFNASVNKCQQICHTTKQLQHVYPIIRINRSLFREQDTGFLFSCIKPRLLPHQLKWFEQRHYLGQDASNTFVPIHIRDWSGNILSGRYDTVRSCLIHKYNNYELFHKTQTLCAKHRMDVQMVIQSFKRASCKHEQRWSNWKQQRLYSSIMTLMNVWIHHRPKLYSYNVFRTSHRNNYILDRFEQEKKYRVILQQLLSQFSCCEFPHCTTIYAQCTCKQTWSRLCPAHRQQWSHAFESIIRPSTEQLLHVPIN
jgi:hypothetical protein